jgi:hypothetical protein
LLTDYNLLTDYVERAVQLEDLAADEPDPTLVARLLRKARISFEADEGEARGARRFRSGASAHYRGARGEGR